jgi:hypothetical protein
MLAQKELGYSPNGPIRSMILGLKQLLGEKPGEWPDQWEKGFAHDFNPLLWHIDYDEYVPTILKMIEDEIRA